MQALTSLRRSFDRVWKRLKPRDPSIAWRQAAEANGLTGIEAGWSVHAGKRIDAWKGSLQVRIQNVTADDNMYHLQITVKGIAAGLSVRTEGVGARIQKSLGLEGDIETGDDSFDASFVIRGDGPLAHALLDGDARGALRRLFGGQQESITLAAGELVVQYEHGREVACLPDDLEQVLGLADRLVEPDDLGARLARTALDDGVEGVRRCCLMELLAHYGQHAATRETLRRALSDESEPVRLEAALPLGEEGHAVLRALAFDAESETCAVRAVKALGAGVQHAEALKLLEESLDRRRPAVAVAGIEVIGDHGRASADAEAVLIQRCLSYREEGVRHAAATALGRVGTVTAVLPLQEAARAAGGGLRRALEEAARTIQSRLQGAERGQLTVSEAEGGTVTLAADGGEVSLPDPDRPRGE